MKVLITGITGFVGSHMADYILSEHKDYEVFGIKRWRSKMDNVKHLTDKVKFFECDIQDYTAVYNVLKEVRPDKIFHMAAQSYVPASWTAPAETMKVNTIGQMNIFEATRALKLDSIIQICCSSEEYGMVYENECPIKETNPLRPLSPYGVSKVAQDMMGYQYAMSYNMNIKRTRAFNHSGPRRGDVFVLSNFAKQIAEIEVGVRQPVINVGNLTAKRDFTDVRDMVRAYWLATEHCEAGAVYNICSGETHTMESLLGKLIGMSTVKGEIQVKEDPARMRPSDVPILWGDNSAFVKKTGWERRYSIDDTLKDILNYWRERISK